MRACSAKSFLLSFTLLVVACWCTESKAQMAPPGPEMDVYKKDVGDWDCVIKVWSEPGAEPIITKGTESNRMFGDYWLIVEFKGDMFGNAFEGRGMYGYDTKKKKYVGTWIDSLGPFMMRTEGTYDKESETLTVSGDSPGPDGVTPFTYTMTTVYKGGKRIMTMHMLPKGAPEDQKMKLFEMSYTKKK